MRHWRARRQRSSRFAHDAYSGTRKIDARDGQQSQENPLSLVGLIDARHGVIKLDGEDIACAAGVWRF